MKLRPRFGWLDFIVHMGSLILLRVAPRLFDVVSRANLARYKKKMGVTHRTAANGRIYEV